MLPRSWAAVIVVAWLLLCGWLLRRDLWPRFATDEPESFTIPLVDEPKVGISGRRQARLIDTPWRVLHHPDDWRGSRDAGRAETRVLYDVPHDALVFQGA